MTAPTRRSFLAAAAAAATATPWLRPGAHPARPRSQPLKILVLGGTGFLGPHFVRQALANGHTVTLFNRGRTNPGLFDDLEQLRGDRDKHDLEALKGREFDAIVDTSGYLPDHVRETAEIFKDTAAHYQFISTISVYGAFGGRPAELDENGETAKISDEEAAKYTTIRASRRHYGAFKARCEAAAEAVMPGRVSNIRPGLIVGPGDVSDRFTWWPVRMDRGGEVLCPGDRDGHVQFIDVRDLASWMVHVLEQNVTGVYNANGFHGRVSMIEMLSACKCATSTPVEMVWASEEFLQAEGVRPYMQMPVWIPREGRSMIQNAKAVAQGLTFRPIGDTARDTLAWAKAERGAAPFERTGLAPERERELIAKWRSQEKR
ncbi:MAG: NAD-dependent epimerase/dehydratase family protein [Planctomycetes bacterium]|nr:NAD-dependent epimerase/dehydratase family protein [Planctomycetota bacterium]